MPRWIDVALKDDVKPGMWTLVEVDEVVVMVINQDGNYYAIQDICTHDGGTLSDGEIADCEIICPRHGARFDIRTGEVLAPPAYESLPTYEVRVHNNMIQVQSKFS